VKQIVNVKGETTMKGPAA